MEQQYMMGDPRKNSSSVPGLFTLGVLFGNFLAYFYFNRSDILAYFKKLFLIGSNICPGGFSGQAGKASGCKGCPGQAACASNTDAVENIAQSVAFNLKYVKKIVLVVSGKGGVGKSTITSQLAQRLSKEKKVAVLDIDLCGPTQPLFLGVQEAAINKHGDMWIPVEISDTLKVMSIGYILEHADDPVIWRGARKNTLIKEFMCRVEWGELDVLLIDTPPGTSDEHLSLVSFLKDLSDSVEVIAVTTPEEAACADVRKQLGFYKKANLKITGVIVNKYAYVCPKCSHQEIILPHGCRSKTNNNISAVDAMSSDFNVKILAYLNIDSSIAQSCQTGEENQNPAFKEIASYL